MRVRRLALLSWLTVCASAALAETLFYVAPAGSDAWSGRLAAPNADRTDGPFATPQRAQVAVREALGRGLELPVAVELRGGTYALARTLVFGPADSGTAQAPVIWRARAGERPVLSGGRALAGWRETMVGGLRRWTVMLPDVHAGAWNFRQLFISKGGGPYERRYRPHLGMLAVDHLTYSPRRPGAAHRAAQKDFICYPGDVRQWENLRDVELVALHMWSSSRLFIERVDTERRVVEFTGLPTFALGQVGPHNPYYVENVREALSTPGQWYLDRPSGVLTYLPLADEALDDCRLVAPALTRVLALEGDWAAGRFVSDLRFERLAFSHNESPLPREGYGGSQGQPDLPAAIEAVGARRCTFARCTIAQTGNYGVGLGLGCQNNRLDGCRLYDLGGGGIKVGDIRMANTAVAPELPTGNVIENCALSDGGLMYYSANAIWAGIVRGTVIRHNEIWNFPYSGIAVGWCWNDSPTSCAANRIEYNRIHHVVALLADGASIYTLGRQPGTIIRGNVLYDNVRGPFAREHWQLGLYLDEGSAEMLVEQNLAYGVGTHGFNINGGAQNLVQNNIFGPVHGNHAPYIRSYSRPFSRGNVFTHNLSWCDSPNLADGAWDRAQFDCRANLYWNTAGLPLSFAGKTWAQWQAGGQDAGSVNADPQFVDPARGDFRLKPGSPALALGFVPFDPAQAGLSPEYRNVAAPVAVTPPPVYAMRAPVLPPDAPGFRIDCEDVPVGVVPREFTAACAPGHDSDVQVTAAAARRGARSLKLTDHRGLPRPFLPYLTHTLAQPLTSGTVKLACDLQPQAGSPGAVSFECRDYQRGAAGKEFVSGPALVVATDGRLQAGGQSLGRVAPGEWVHLELEFSLTTREATASATTADGQTRRVKVALSPDFRALSRLMVICGDEVDGACYLDDLVLTVAP